MRHCPVGCGNQGHPITVGYKVGDKVGSDVGSSVGQFLSTMYWVENPWGQADNAAEPREYEMPHIPSTCEPTVDVGMNVILSHSSTRVCAAFVVQADSVMPVMLVVNTLKVNVQLPVAGLFPAPSSCQDDTLNFCTAQ